MLLISASFVAKFEFDFSLKQENVFLRGYSLEVLNLTERA